MEDPESQLKRHYADHRDACVRTFLEHLKATGLPMYAQAPEAALLPLVGRSMDNLIEALLTRSPDAYLASQRANFERRLAEGAVAAEMLQAMDAARPTMEVVLGQAYAAQPAHRATMLQRADRYLSMTRTMLVSMTAGR